MRRMDVPPDVAGVVFVPNRDGSRVGRVSVTGGHCPLVSIREVQYGDDARRNVGYVISMSLHMGSYIGTLLKGVSHYFCDKGI